MNETTKEDDYIENIYKLATYELAAYEEQAYDDEAYVLAASCWKDEEKNNPDVTMAMAIDMASVRAGKIIAGFMRVSVRNAHKAGCYKRDAQYYKRLLVKIGESIGPRAFLADDGTESKDVLCNKLPEIIENDYIRRPNNEV